MKRIITSLATIVLLTGAVKAQVGINNTSPEATLDIKASTGTTTNEGILIPRLSKTRVAQIAAANLKEATQVYIDDVTYTGTNPAVSDITQKGFYYYDPSGKWKTISLDKNLYTSDGQLTGNRNVDLNGKNLAFTGTGNVGIGTATPGAKLDIVSDNPTEAIRISRYVGLNGYENIIRMIRARGTSTTPNAVLNGDNIASLAFGAYDGTNTLYSALINTVVNGTVSNGSVPQDLYFSTGTNDSRPERMRINSGGNVGIGTGTPATRLHVKTEGTNGEVAMLETAAFETIFNLKNSAVVGSGSIWAIVVRNNGLFSIANRSKAHYLSILEDGNVGIGTVTPGAKLGVNGTVKATDLYLTSDARLKKNITPVTHALATVKELKPVEYDKKATMEATQYDHHEMGFIAQDLQKVLPQVVREGTDKDKTLTVNYTAIIPLLVKAMQEQQANFEKAQATIEQQQIEINNLKKHLK